MPEMLAALVGAIVGAVLGGVVTDLWAVRRNRLRAIRTALAYFRECEQACAEALVRLDRRYTPRLDVAAMRPSLPPSLLHRDHRIVEDLSDVVAALIADGERSISSLGESFDRLQAELQRRVKTLGDPFGEQFDALARESLRLDLESCVSGCRRVRLRLQSERAEIWPQPYDLPDEARSPLAT